LIDGIARAEVGIGAKGIELPIQAALEEAEVLLIHVAVIVKIPL